MPTIFVGNYYEVNATTGEVTKYYYAGATRIATLAPHCARRNAGVSKQAVPQNPQVTYLLGDHLGSTSIVTDEAGTLLVETRYKPCPYRVLREGEVRYSTPDATLPTRYSYTGQYSHMSDEATDLGNVGFGLMFYNARWYDPSLGRFAQADTIVPDGVQGYDRYAYVNNSPVNFTDPTGHVEACGKDLGEACKHADSILSDFGIKTSGLKLKQKWAAANMAARSGTKFFAAYGGIAGFTSPLDAFKKLHGNISLNADSSRSTACETSSDGSGGSTINCASNSLYGTAFLHEFGHSLDIFSGKRASSLDTYPFQGNNIDGDGSDNASWTRTADGFICDTFRCLEHPPRMGYWVVNGAGVEELSMDQTSGYAKLEQWADLYMNWVLDGTGDPNHGFSNDVLGNARRAYMPQQFNYYYP